MVFSSAIFLFAFLPIVIFAYHAFSSLRYKNSLLLIASLFFYSWGEPINVFVMLLSIVVNWGFSLLLQKYKKKNLPQNVFFALSICFNLGLLFYFKYIDFFIENFNSIFLCNIQKTGVALPIGISFFTFQALSYIIDVKRNRVPVQKNLLDLGLYISFFPQLIAGPIVRYIDIKEQIQKRHIDFQKFNAGWRFAFSGG